MKKQLAFLVVILMIPLVLVPQVLASTGNGETSSQTELEIDGDDMTLYTQKDLIVFEGNVIAVYGEYTITGDLLNYYNDKKMAVIEGDVRITGDNLKAKAAKVEFDIEKNILTMTGNVEVNRDGQMIRGNKVVFNLKTEVYQVKDAKIKIPLTN